MNADIGHKTEVVEEHLDKIESASEALRAIRAAMEICQSAECCEVEDWVKKLATPMTLGGLVEAVGVIGDSLGVHSDEIRRQLAVNGRAKCYPYC